MSLHLKSMLLSAIRSNNILAVRSILSTTKRARLIANDTDFYLLRKSIQYDRMQISEFFLERGFRTSLPTFTGNTPLHLAVTKRNCSSLVKRLLDHGTKVNQRNRRNETPLHLAFEASTDDKVLQMLLNAHLKRSSINETNDWGLSFLHIACATANLESVRQLVEVGGADVNAQVNLDCNSPYAGSTPLHMAVHGSMEIVEYLIMEGANVHVSDDSESTPIHLALELGETDIIELLFDCDDLRENLSNDNGLTYFMAACVCSDPEFVLQFLELGYDFGSEPFFNVNNVVPTDDCYPLRGFSPLHFAANFGRLETVKLLLAHGADCCANGTQYKVTPIEFAAMNSYQDVANLIKAHCQGYDYGV